MVNKNKWDLKEEVAEVKEALEFHEVTCNEKIHQLQKELKSCRAKLEITSFFSKILAKFPSVLRNLSEGPTPFPLFLPKILTSNSHHTPLRMCSRTLVLTGP